MRPELAWGLDVGLEHFFADGGILSASSYVRRIDDLTGRSLSDASGRWVSMPINEGQATSRGIELEAKFPLRALVDTAPALELRLNLSRNWSRISSIPGPNNRLDGQTPLSANVGIDYRLADVPLTLGGNFNFQNSGLLRTSANETSYATVTRSLDMFGLWKFDKRSQLRLSLSNILHQDTLSSSTYADAAASMNQLLISPNHASVRLTFEHKFL